MTCGSCDASIEGVDHEVTVANDSSESGEYTLLFGSGIRSGEIVGVGTDDDDAPAVTSQDGVNDGVVERDLSGGSVDGWAANGPIYFKNTGRSPLRFERAGYTASVAPGEELTTSCPTEKKRKTALGALAGGAAAVALGAIFN